VWNSKTALAPVRELFWGMLGRGDGELRGIGVSGSGYNEVGQAVSCNSNWWWCVTAIFEAVGRNRYFQWQFCVISDSCV